jgi:hypothetical protein
MRKHVLILLVVIFAISLTASFVKGQAANAERAKIQQECEFDLSCPFTNFQK